MKVLFMVRREYYDAIANGSKTWEYRKATKRWLTVAGKKPTEAVFVCGAHRIMRRRILQVHHYDSAFTALGRPLHESELDMLGDGPVLGFEIGGPVDG